MQVVFYHKDCNDGMMAAYSIWEHKKGSTLCIPITYKEFQDQTPEEFFEMCFVDKIVNAMISSGFMGSYREMLRFGKSRVIAYLVDISVPKEILRKISETFLRVVVLDHHQSALEMYETDKEFIGGPAGMGGEINHYTFNGNTRIFMDKIHSGARLTWHYMNPLVKEPPYYIKLVSEYDTWNKTDKDADFFASGFRSMNCKSFRDIEEKIVSNVKGVIEYGELVDNDRENRANAAISRGIEVTVVNEEGTTNLVIVNSNLDLSSLIGNNLVRDYNVNVGATYVINKDLSVSWSIRSKKPFSCLFIAKHFGGGGHEQACGFSTSLDVLNDILKTKTLILKPKEDTSPEEVNDGDCVYGSGKGCGCLSKS